MTTTEVVLSKWPLWLDLRTSLVFMATLLGGILWKSSRRKSDAAPGPAVWPILGNLPQIMNEMRKHRSQFKMFHEFSKIYGPVFSLRIGSKDTVMVTDYENIRQVLKDNAEDFNNRPTEPLFEQLTHGNGMILANGKKWEEIRKFTVLALRDFGVGKRSMEHIIQTEADIICERMLTHGQPFHPRRLMADAVANVIFSIIFGDRFDYGDPGFQSILQKMDYISKTAGPTLLDRFLPFLKYLPIDTPLKKILRLRDELKVYTYKKIDEHRETFDPEMTRDYIDLYLKITQEGHKYTTLNEPHLFHTILDLYFAGSETTSTSLDWFILHMVVHPEVQEKCQREIDKVVGPGRKVCYEDRHQLPYMVAALRELQRVANVAPLTVPHATTRDTRLSGFFIPANTTVIPVPMNVHVDPKYFPDSLQYKPERWLQDDKLIDDEHFLPFGMGPRKCVGQGLAKMELFLFASNFLQHHSFRIPEGEPVPSTEGNHTGITLQPKPFHVVLQPRITKF